MPHFSKFSNHLILTFCILATILCASACNSSSKTQLSDEPHVYPVLPGTEEWDSMTPQERRESCMVTQEEAAGLTTRALVETVLTYPYLVDLFCFDSFQTGVDCVSSNFPCLPELLQRDDAAEELQAYINTQKTQANAQDGVALDIRYAQALLNYINDLRADQASPDK